MRFHLCQDNDILTQVRAPFVEASIEGVMLDSMKNKDLSGALQHVAGTSVPSIAVMQLRQSAHTPAYLSTVFLYC